MVKGVSKRIVHVKTLPGDIFTEAIFILKEEATGISEEEMLREARSIAEKSGVKTKRMSRKTASNLCFGALGAFLVSIFWILSTI